MPKLNIAHLMTISRPVMDGFSKISPKPWDRKAILLELWGEIGSLAHHVQHWDGFKKGAPDLAKLSDECSDILFLILRLAHEDGIELPKEIEIRNGQNNRTTDFVLNLCACLARLLNPSPSCDIAGELQKMIQKLGCLAVLLGVDLVKAHELEMRIALQFFHASGEKWPRPQFLRHPIATIRLWRLLWKRRKK